MYKRVCSQCGSDEVHYVFKAHGPLYGSNAEAYCEAVNQWLCGPCRGWEALIERTAERYTMVVFLPVSEALFDAAAMIVEGWQYAYTYKDTWVFFEQGQVVYWVVNPDTETVVAFPPPVLMGD